IAAYASRSSCKIFLLKRFLLPINICLLYCLVLCREIRNFLKGFRFTGFGNLILPTQEYNKLADKVNIFCDLLNKTFAKLNFTKILLSSSGDELSKLFTKLSSSADELSSSTDELSKSPDEPSKILVKLSSSADE